jgi:glucose/arabinose dehydrogenase
MSRFHVARPRGARKLVLCIAVVAATGGILAPTCRPAIRTRLVATLTQPTFVTAPAGDARLFITQRRGQIRIVENGNLLATPFLDIQSLVSEFGEGGLLGLAFSPQYASNGEFFVYYTNLDGSPLVARYLRSATNPNLADPASGFVLLTLTQPAGETVHKGGTIAFSPVDGFLYVGRGDGGMRLLARDGTSLLGKMLRIDVSGGPTAPYTIPASNPFVGPDGVLDEIWSQGFRNPFRFSFDRENGDLWIADVGQAQREEIDYEPAGSGGLDYGWPSHEGTNCFQPTPEAPCDDPQNPTLYQFPIYEYAHDEGCSVTGGVRYRGSAAFLAGAYLFGDFCTGSVWALIDGMRIDFTTTLGGPLTSLVAISEDGLGEVYLTQMNVNRVLRIE